MKTLKAKEKNVMMALLDLARQEGLNGRYDIQQHSLLIWSLEK